MPPHPLSIPIINDDRTKWEWTDHSFLSIQPGAYVVRTPISIINNAVIILKDLLDICVRGYSPTLVNYIVGKLEVDMVNDQKLRKARRPGMSEAAHEYLSSSRSRKVIAKRKYPKWGVQVIDGYYVQFDDNTIFMYDEEDLMDANNPIYQTIKDYL